MVTFQDRVKFLLADRKLTQAQATRLAGFKNPAFISDIVRGHKSGVNGTNIAALARALSTTEEYLRGDTDDSAAQPTRNGSEGYRPPPVFLGERDLPVYAAVEGGPGEMVVSTDPIEIVPRPWFMNEVRDGYAILITGESMIPAYRPGEMAIVNPRLPPVRNQDTIFIAQSDERGEFRASIKHLLRWTDKDWFVEQYNPPTGQPAMLVMPRLEWNKALRVVGKYNR